MKAAQISNYGGKETVSIRETKKPTLNEDEVLVEVYAASANPFDWKLRDGNFKDSIELKLPATLGGDVAGVALELGNKVKGFKIGEPVYGMANAAGGQGSFAQFTPVKASQLAEKPKSIDFTAAAALPLTASAAYQAVFENINLQDRQKILIHGGAGGIGSTAIQLAKYLGAYVATTASGADADFTKALGADEVIDYKTEDFSGVIKGYDAVFDTVGGDSNAKSYRTLKPGGVLVSMVEQPDQERVKKYGIRYIQQNTIATTERLNKISELVDTGALQVNIDKAFPLDQAAEALDYLKSGHTRGKVIITVK